jgi:hypothetical protein
VAREVGGIPTAPGRVVDAVAYMKLLAATRPAVAVISAGLVLLCPERV